MYFDKELFLFHQRFESQRDLFGSMAHELEDAGCVKSTYLNGIIEREKQFPTGLLINGVGIAMPHTDSVHVNSSQACFASLAQPIVFEDMGDRDHKIEVELVFMLAMAQPHEQVEALQNLIALFQDEAAVAAMKRCDTAEELDLILKRAKLA